MDTALNIANLTTEPVAAAGRKDATVRAQQSQSPDSRADRQAAGKEDSKESSFANVLKSESRPAKIGQGNQRDTQQTSSANEAGAEAGTEAKTETGTESVDAEAVAAEAAENGASGQTSELLQMINADSTEDTEKAGHNPAAASELRLTEVISETEDEADSAQAMSRAAATDVDKNKADAGLLRSANSAQANTAADNRQQDSNLPHKLSGDINEQVDQARNSESLSAAGKTLPPPGKSLPAGFFPAAGSDPQAFQRLGDKLTHSKDPISLDGQFIGRMEYSGKTDFDGSGENLLRTIFGAQAATGGENGTAGPGSQAGNHSSDASTILNQLAATSSMERSLSGSRPGNAATLESMPGFSLTASAGSKEFDQQLSSRIRWMGNLKMSAAELKLHPAELGSIEVRISTEDDQTRVSFITSTSAAREVIENSMPRLRELLGDSGLQLEQGDVSQREQGTEEQTAELGRNNRFDAEDDSESESQIIHMKRESRSQVDHYV
jgi:flagellar hook-length control protein FliK